MEEKERRKDGRVDGTRFQFSSLPIFHSPGAKGSVRQHLPMFNTPPEMPRVLDDIPESEQHALLEKLARWIVRRNLTAPAILFLETGKPLNFLGCQLLLAFGPFVQMFFKGQQYHKLALILEKDANVELLIACIEQCEHTE